VEKYLLTIPETAEAIGLGRSKVYELVSAGEIETVRIGKAHRVPRDAIERFVEKLRAAAMDPVL
jgi:excisionase family DNA binding protein